VKGRRFVRDVGGALRFAYLRRLGVPLDDLDRLDVATGAIREGGLYVDAETGESRLLQAGALVPLGVWIARRDLDEIVDPEAAEDLVETAQGFGEGWGAQGNQRDAFATDADRQGAMVRDDDLPGATGDPARDPAGERGMTPRRPSAGAATAGWDQPPVEREVHDGRED
jgi:hypothetical protein